MGSEECTPTRDNRLVHCVDLFINYWFIRVRPVSIHAECTLNMHRLHSPYSLSQGSLVRRRFCAASPYVCSHLNTLSGTLIFLIAAKHIFVSCMWKHPLLRRVPWYLLVVDATELKKKIVVEGMTVGTSNLVCELINSVVVLHKYTSSIF